MNNYIELIKEFKPILITIATSVTTAILTTLILDYKKRFRKIKFFIKKWECETSIENEVGASTYIKVNSLNIKDMIINCQLEIYNASEVNKIMRNIKIEFFYKSFFSNKGILSKVPLDEDTKIKKTIVYELSEVGVINIEPKKCIEKVFYLKFNSKSDIERLKDINKIYISYINERNKKEKQLIKQNIID